MAVSYREEYVIRKTPGDEDTEDDHSCEAPDQDVEQMKQSLYSPDLSLCDWYLFWKLKCLLRNDEFGSQKAGDEESQRK
ncbi:Hypothetical protein FKW44_021983 [Caligus rogercresseyi]|uniref:Uncharacterized protein n=1 Tax=Caligus rogercresseyi TaxID=217165 RepID=A0A7T8GS62_CALRO|nr:Hypothetical protein FKW44_021983 [Caligus rogercresseyi]